MVKCGALAIKALSVPVLCVILAGPLRPSSIAGDVGNELTPVPAPVPMFGTSFSWELSIEEAAKKARSEGKLLLILHVSGFFNNPDLT